MTDRFPVFVFRSRHFAPRGDTVVSVAPLDLVVSIYGGGGLQGEGGLSNAFGGAAVFKSEQTGLCYLGVWGARNASRFRTALRESGAALDIVREPPPGRLVFFEKRRGERPDRPGHRPR